MLNMLVEINFPRLTCKHCESEKQICKHNGQRWGVYCKDCMRFIRWATESDRGVINARIAWLKEHDEGVNNDN